LAELLTYVDPDAVGGGTGVDWANAYVSLSIMEAAEQDDFDTANNWLHCYTRSSSGGDDTTACTINGSVTSATDYIKIEAVSGHRMKKTGWDAAIYLMDVTGDCINVWDNHVWIDGLQLDATGNAIEIANVAAGSWCYISNCRHSGSGYLVQVFDADGDAKVWNCINNGGGRFTYVTDGNCDVYNSICYGAATDGFDYNAGTTGEIINCVSFKNGDDFNIDGGATVTIDYCASDDGDGDHPVAESGGGVEWPDDFVDAANGDFTLKATSNLVGAGIADPGSGLFSTDIDGDTYATPPSLGVDEIAGGATELVVAGLNVGLTLESPVLSQLHGLTVAGMDIGLTLEAPVLSQLHNLSVNSMDCGLVLGSPTLTQLHNLVVASMDIALTFGTPTLNQLYTLAVASMDVGLTLASPALTQLHNLIVASIDIASTLGSPTLTQLHNLVVASVDVGLTLGAPVLNQLHTLIVASMDIASTFGEPVLNQLYTLIVEGMNLGISLEAPVLTQLHILSINGVNIALNFDNVLLDIGDVTLIVDGIDIGLTLEELILSMSTAQVLFNYPGKERFDYQGKAKFKHSRDKTFTKNIGRS